MQNIQEQNIVYFDQCNIIVGLTLADGFIQAVLRKIVIQQMLHSLDTDDLNSEALVMNLYFDHRATTCSVVKLMKVSQPLCFVYFLVFPPFLLNHQYKQTYTCVHTNTHHFRFTHSPYILLLPGGVESINDCITKRTQRCCGKVTPKWS